MSRKSLVCILMLCLPAFAQPNLSGTIGEFSAETGMRGAVANRKIADQLFKQALADEQTGRETFNVRLLAKAWTTTKDAKAANDQAKEFARAALHGMKSGSYTGEFSAQRFGLDESQLQDLASNDSPYLPAVQDRLKYYPGFSLSADKMSLETPFGKFGVETGTGMMIKLGKAMATLFGHDPTDVDAGVQDAIDARNGVVAAVNAEVDAQMNAAAGAGAEGAGAPQAVGSAPAANTAENPPLSAENSPENSRAPSASAEAEDAEFSPAATDESDLDKKRQALLRHQAAVRRQLGMSAPQAKDPIGSANENIFHIVHRRYQSMRTNGNFFESEFIETEL